MSKPILNLEPRMIEESYQRMLAKIAEDFTLMMIARRRHGETYAMNKISLRVAVDQLIVEETLFRQKTYETREKIIALIELYLGMDLESAREILNNQPSNSSPTPSTMETRSASDLPPRCDGELSPAPPRGSSEEYDLPAETILLATSGS